MLESNTTHAEPEHFDIINAVICSHKSKELFPKLTGARSDLTAHRCQVTPEERRVVLEKEREWVEDGIVSLQN